MFVKIDWLSFSLVWHSRSNRGGENVVSNIQAEMDQLDPDLMTWLDIGAHWEDGAGRKPYSHSWRHPDSKITLFFNPALTHCLFEVSGTGCDWLWERGRMLSLLNVVQRRVTRIDIACDMECDVSPEDFVTQRKTGRFRSTSHIKEESGETHYVGSRSSNRYARVYRYNAPHPRSHLLRSEFVLKDEDAKLCSSEVLSSGLEAVAMALGDRFGWEHPVWNKTLAEPATLTAYRAERPQGKTVFWLCNTIAPLLTKMHHDGNLDVYAWFEEYVNKILQTGDFAALQDAWEKSVIDDIPF